LPETWIEPAAGWSRATGIQHLKNKKSRHEGMDEAGGIFWQGTPLTEESSVIAWFEVFRQTHGLKEI
jgi:hypothetical protein